MALRDEIQKRIDKKHGEIAALEGQIRDARVYVQALEDTLRLVPRNAEDGESEPQTDSTLRTGSKVEKARDALRSTGKALHIVQLLAAIGLPNTAPQRMALAGSLGSYVRKGIIFTKPAPNTFGLLEFKAKSSGTYGPPSPGPEPPPNFGVDEPIDEPTESEDFDPLEFLVDSK